MANKSIRKVNRKTTEAKKTIGSILLVTSVLLFFFSCIPNFLNIGRFFKAIFGILVYPLSVFMGLVGVALLMRLKYTVRKKYSTYLFISLFCLICFCLLTVVQTIPIKIIAITNIKAPASIVYIVLLRHLIYMWLLIHLS